MKDEHMNRIASTLLNRLSELGYAVIDVNDYERLEAENKALREELSALRSRVGVVPDGATDLRWHPEFNRGWNACLDELARLNGKTVSEGLLREAERHLGNWLELHACECEGGFHYCGRDQVAKTHRELRALLNEGKEERHG